jgi:hypothetical protein
MALGIKVCKVCGREYEACHTLRPNLNSEFRWQDVACCPEHGAEYLRQIMISRGEIVEEHPVQEDAPKKKTRKKKSEVAQAEDQKEMA